VFFDIDCLRLQTFERNLHKTMGAGVLFRG
jgi:hypothetical protein